MIILQPLHYSYVVSLKSTFEALNGLHSTAVPPPGDLVYNVTDTLGWCYVAYCNASCQVEVNVSPCATTLPPTTTLFTTASTAIPSTTPGLDCVDVYPPRKV